MFTDVPLVYTDVILLQPCTVFTDVPLVYTDVMEYCTPVEGPIIKSCTALNCREQVKVLSNNGCTPAKYINILVFEMLVVQFS